MTTKQTDLREGTSNSPKRKSLHVAPASAARDVQGVVTELVRQNGVNVVNWADWPRMLSDLGVGVSQVTPKVLAQAKQALSDMTTINYTTYYARERVALPKASDFPTLLDWLKRCTELRGFHPHTVATSPRLLGEGGVTKEQFSDELLSRATHETWSLFRVYAETHNKSALAEGRWTYDLGSDSFSNWHKQNRKSPCLSTVPRDNQRDDAAGGSDRTTQRRSSSVTTATATNVQITKSVALLLFAELGVGEATKWGMKTLGKNLNSLHKTAGVKEKISNPDLQDVISDLLAAGAAGETVEVVDDAEETPVAPAKAKPAAKKGAKGKAKSASAATNGESNRHTPAAAKPAKRVKGKASAAKKGASNFGKGEGICAAVVDLLTKATAKKPITKQTIVAKMVERFPDRDPVALQRTVYGQVNYNLPKKGVEVKGEHKTGYWVES